MLEHFGKNFKCAKVCTNFGWGGGGGVDWPRATVLLMDNNLLVGVELRVFGHSSVYM